MPDIFSRKNIMRIEFDFEQDWEQWFFLTSDWHLDSEYFKKNVFLDHMETVAKRNAMVIAAGDIFDGMQGRQDPRRNNKALRDYIKTDAYFDEILAANVKTLAPFAKYLTMIGYGNHDTSIIKNNGTDMIIRLVDRLNLDHGGNVKVGGYGGWIRFAIKEKERNNKLLATKRIKYFHGAGGEAPVTKGTIQTNRQGVYLPDADVILNGHSHTEYVLSVARERISSKDSTYKDLQTFIRTPGYKDAYDDGSGGWEVERGGVPKPIGSCWMRAFRVGKGIEMEFTAAVK